jgi:hypothetical protein
VITRRSRVVDAFVGTPSAAARILPGPVIRLRLAALFAAQLFDYGTFTLMVERHGIRAELNPIVAHGFATFGLPIVAVAKIALIVLIGSIIVVLAHHDSASRTTRRCATFVAMLAVVSGLVGGISNVLT